MNDEIVDEGVDGETVDGGTVDGETVDDAISDDLRGLATAPGGKLHRVWTAPLVRNEPVLIPAGDDVAWSLARTEDGTLQLSCQRVTTVWPAP